MRVCDPYSPFLLHFLTIQRSYALSLPLGLILHITLHIRHPLRFICLPNLLCSLLCVCAFGCVLYLLPYDILLSIPRDTSSPPPLFIDIHPSSIHMLIFPSSFYALDSSSFLTCPRCLWLDATGRRPFFDAERYVRHRDILTALDHNTIPLGLRPQGLLHRQFGHLRPDARVFGSDRGYKKSCAPPCDATVYCAVFLPSLLRSSPN